MEVSFSFKFPVQPKGRPRRGKYGNFYTPTETVRCEQSIGVVATAARLAAGVHSPFDVPVAAELAISASSRGDIDNLAKTILDALNKGVLYEDDRQVVELRVSRVQGEETRVTITEVGVDPVSKKSRRSSKSKPKRRRNIKG